MRKCGEASNQVNERMLDVPVVQWMCQQVDGRMETVSVGHMVEVWCTRRAGDWAGKRKGRPVPDGRAGWLVEVGGG